MRLAFVSRILSIAALLVSAEANAAGFAQGDQIKVKRAAPMLFRTEKFRDANEGEILNVLAYRPELKKVFVLATGKDGKEIALAIDADAVELVPADPATALAKARAAAGAKNFVEASAVIERALRSNPGEASLSSALPLVKETAAASQAIEAAKMSVGQTAAEVARLRKNATVTDRPNALNPKDTSNQDRAAKMREQADGLEQQSRTALSDAETRYAAALSALKGLSVAGPRSESTGGIPGLDSNATTRTVVTPTTGMRPSTSGQPSNPINYPVQPVAEGDVPEGTLIPNVFSEHNLLALGGAPDRLGGFYVISIDHPRIFRAHRSDIAPLNLNLKRRIEFDPLEHRLSSLMCEWSLFQGSDDERKRWNNDLDKAPKLVASWKEECKRHLELIAEYEDMERIYDRMFVVVQKLDDNLYEAYYEGGYGVGKVRFVLKTTDTIFKSEGKAHLTMKFLERAPVALKSGFEQKFSVFEEADVSAVRRVRSDLKQSSTRLARMIITHSIGRNELADFLEKLLPIAVKAKDRSARIGSDQNNIWDPHLSGFLLESAFIELVRSRLQEAK